MTRIEHIVIVGGGTSGWLAAAYLARNLGSDQPDGPRITLIESSEIETVGVGEATVPPVRTVIASLGLDEAEFMRATSATFKLGIRFDQWLGREAGGRPDSYYHVFGEAGRFGQQLQELMAPYWVIARDSIGKSFVDFSMIEGRICDAGRGPKKTDGFQFGGPMQYAYHFDAGLLVGLLKKVGCASGVEHLVGTVKNVRLAEDGSIAALDTEEHGELTADLYLDCTGFGAYIIEKAMGVGFDSLSDKIFCDRAIACQIPFTDPGQAIPPFTIATAQENGWTWDIPLSNRRGVGYVYSSRYTDDARAEEVLAGYLGEQASNVKMRRLKMRTGLRRQQWFKNCVSIGLSAGFLEPLESTGIHILDVSLRYLVDYFPPTEKMSLAAKQFNDAMNDSYVDIIDFIKLHYALSRRTDTDFWIDNRRDETLTDTLRDKLESWRYRVPGLLEFSANANIFGLAGHLQVLYGMDYLPDLADQEHRFRRWPEARQRSLELDSIARGGLAALPDHRALVDTAYSTGFRKAPARGS